MQSLGFQAELPNLQFWINTGIAKVLIKVALVFYLVATGEWKYTHVCANTEKGIKGNTERTEARLKKKNKSDAEEDMKE